MIEISVTSEVSVGVSVGGPVGVAVVEPLGVAEVLGVGHGDLLRLVAYEADGAADVGGDGGLEAALAEEAVDRLDLVPAWNGGDVDYCLKLKWGCHVIHGEINATQWQAAAKLRRVILNRTWFPAYPNKCSGKG